MGRPPNVGVHCDTRASVLEINIHSVRMHLALRANLSLLRSSLSLLFQAKQNLVIRLDRFSSQTNV